MKPNYDLENEKMKSFFEFDYEEQRKRFDFRMKSNQIKPIYH